MKTAKRAISMGLVLLLLGSTAAGAAASGERQGKEETIYAVTDNSGNVNNLYAVNSFELQTAGEITDYGDYSSVRNLTTTDEISYTDDTATVAAPAGRFSYQGDMVRKELPWRIVITYTLDGEKIDPGELAGKSGEVEITISIKKNEGFGEEYFQHFTLQISASLDTEHFSSIEASGATLANAGKNKSITFTHLPGEEKDYTIKAEATDFQMDPITVSGILLSMSIELTGLDGLKSDFTKLTDGIGELDDGAKELENGSSQFKSGLSSVAAGGSSLTEASSGIGSGLSQAADGLSQVISSSGQLKTLATALSASSDPQVQALAAGYLAQLSSLEQISSGLNQLSAGYSQLDSGISQLVQGVNSLADSYKKLHSGVSGLRNGIGELKSSTSGLDTKIQDKVDDMLAEYTNSGYTPTSFLSEKNTDVAAVQFVIRTEGFEPAEKEQPTEAVEPELNFWQKLLKLFGLYQEA
ncbi:hypothetical protein [Papillibacter cinnamivorans]|nr:hypothetical protein [Papillibacter cinnamivorans]